MITLLGPWCQVFAISIAGLMVCSCTTQGNDTPRPFEEQVDMQQGDTGKGIETEGVVTDPFGYIASLTFASAEDGTRYHCLLSAFAQMASDEQLTEYGGDDDHGTVSVSWCRVGSGEEVNDCYRGTIHLKNPDNQALSVWATRDVEGAEVHTYGYVSDWTPADTDNAWSLRFEYSFGDYHHFWASFYPMENGQRQFADALSISSDQRFRLVGHGVDQVIATVIGEASPQDLLHALVESPERLKTVSIERLDAVLLEYQRLIEQQSDLDDEQRKVIVEAAHKKAQQRRDNLTEHATDLHALLQARMNEESCAL